MGRAGSVRYCCGSSRKRDTGQGSQSQSRLKKGRIFTRSCFGSWGGGVGGAFQFRNRAQERELLGGAALQRCGSVLERSASAAEGFMAAPYRGNTGHGVYFVTACTFQKKNLLQSDRMAGLLVEVLLHYRAERKYLLHEFVVMPDHFSSAACSGCHSGASVAVHQRRFFLPGEEGRNLCW